VRVRWEVVTGEEVGTGRDREGAYLGGEGQGGRVTGD
jgi:hypothetical protein